MPKVFFDEQIFEQQAYGGISKYFCELYSELINVSVPGWDYEIHAPFHQNIYLADLSKKTLLLGRLIKYYRFYQQLNKFTIKSGADLTHQTYYFKSKPNQGKNIITCFDLIQELYMPKSKFNDKVLRLKKKSISRADHIIAISEQTKKDLVSYYGVDNQKVSVIPLGVGKSKVEIGSNKIEGPFFLFVGNRAGYKNFESVLIAMADALKEVPYLKLISFGGGQFSVEESILMRKLNLRGHVWQVFGNDEHLAAYYKKAIGLVYPSKYEGFGLPIIEAMQKGCPVITANYGAMLEVAQGRAFHVDPSDPNELAKAMIKLTLDKTLRVSLIQNGYSVASLYSWQKTAEETQKVYEAVLS